MCGAWQIVSGTLAFVVSFLMRALTCVQINIFLTTFLITFLITFVFCKLRSAINHMWQLVLT